MTAIVCGMNTLCVLLAFAYSSSVNLCQDHAGGAALSSKASRTCVDELARACMASRVEATCSVFLVR